MIGALFAAAVLAAPMPVSAQGPVTYGAADPHIQSVYYRADRVIALIGYLGLQTTIQLEPGERIENVAIGDAANWQITPNKRADILFVKPVGRGKPTNMVMVTNRRTYSFALSVAPAKASSANSTWVLRFVVPAPAIRVAPAPVLAPVTPDGKNTSYTVAGPPDLWPSLVFDDGRTTYFRWPEQVSMPAIFAVNADGSEAIVNFNMRDGYVAVQQTAGRFILRRGGISATVTSTPGVEKRLPKHSGQR